jgi:ketosteroid isomerase-like protein
MRYAAPCALFMHGTRLGGDTGRAMSRENVEVVRQAHEAFSREGWDGLFRFFDPKVEFREPPEQPGSAVFKGWSVALEGVKQGWAATWVEHTSVPERWVDVGDRVLLLTIEHLLGRDGIRVTQPAGLIFTVREGKVVLFESYWGHAQALEAVNVMKKGPPR